MNKEIRNDKEIKKDYKSKKKGYRRAFKSTKKILKEDYKKNKHILKSTLKDNINSIKDKSNKILKQGYKKAYKTNKLELKTLYKSTLLKYKTTYKTNKKDVISNFVDTLDYYYKHECDKQIINPPYRKVIDEIGNAITHGVGIIFAIVAFIFMIQKATSIVEIISTIVYSLGMLIMFTSSCLYHSFAYGTKVKRLFRRFDYSSIYLLIGATYTPIVLCYLGGMFGTIFCIVQWLIIITGITVIAVFGPAKFRKIHTVLYVVLGWSALVFLPKMVMNDLNLFWWILAGGVCYTLGIIPFSLNKGPSHFIWHFFVLAGAITQWIGIYLYLF